MARAHRHLDLIDLSQLQAVGDELGASEKHVRYALNRALSRTASRLRSLSVRGLKNKLQLRRLSALRNRLKSIRINSNRTQGFRIWYGLNDMPVSWFKGTPRQTSDGATFRGVDFKGAFVGRSNYSKQKTIFRRKGKERLSIREQLVPVKDEAMVFVEDDIFLDVEEMIFDFFYRDLKARLKYNVGRQT